MENKQLTKDEILHSHPIVSNNRGSDLYVTLEAARLSMDKYADQWKLKYDELCERYKAQDQAMFAMQQEISTLKAQQGGWVKAETPPPAKRWHGKVRTVNRMGELNERNASWFPGWEVEGPCNEYVSEWYDESPNEPEQKEAVDMMCWAYTNIREWDHDSERIYLHDGPTFPEWQLYNEYQKQKQ